MAVSEQVRQRIYTRFSELLGPEDADALMSIFPSSGWDDLVRKPDLDLAVAGLRTELKDDMRQQTNRFITWTLASNTTLVAALAVVVTLAG